MSHHTFAPSLLAAILATAGLTAQTFHAAPSGFDLTEGNSNNTIPWWALSGTYQQVHDASDLAIVFGSPVAVITSLNFRKDGGITTAIVGRSMDMQISLGLTPVTAAGASSVFAANLGPSPQVVLPSTLVNLPGLTNMGTPNPVGWSFPFQAPFTWIEPAGNLCYELRFTNATVSTSAPCDAVSRLNAELQPNVGSGCIATGQTSAAAIGLRSLSMTTGAWRNRLDRAAAATPAVQLIGFGQATFPLPGFCSNLEFLPITSLSSVTSGAGEWDSTLTFGSLAGTPTVDLMAQFAWVDGGLPNGVGLSDASLIRLPPDSIRNVSRIWFGGSQSGLGNETAVSGSLGLRYGLVTIFGQ